MVAATAVLVTCLWVGGIMTILAHVWEWQDLSPDDIDGQDQGPGFGIMLGILFGTLVAPIPGILLGRLSQISKQPRAAGPHGTV
jgi:hypothetical protein